MDLSQLKSLGEIAGIGGIALGALVLLLRPLIATIAGLPKNARAGTINLIAVGCFAIGAFGIAAWTFSQSKGPEVSTRGEKSPAVNSGGNVSINFGSPSAPPADPSANAASPSRSPRGTVRTEGGQSPGVVSGGKVDIEYPPAPAAAPLPGSH
jgi:hypothetical protein